MKSIIKQIKGEKGLDSKFLDQLACECIDKIEDYECASFLNHDTVNFLKPSPEIYTLGNLWNVYSIGCDNGLVGVIKHSDLSMNKVIKDLNKIGCDEISLAIRILKKKIDDLDLELKFMSDVEKRKIYLKLTHGGSWSHDHQLLYNENCCFLPKLRTFVIENHLKFF